MRIITFLVAIFLSSQAIGQSSHFIQIEGNRANALNLLRAGGIKAKEAQVPKFVVPDVTISGADSPVDYGEMVILTADFDVNKVPDGLTDIKFNWTVLDDGKPKNVFVADNGREIAFAVGMKPKRITVILDVNCQFETKETVVVVDKDGKNPTQREVITDAQAVSPSPIMSEIVVGSGPVPTPNPTPTPTPTPAPVFPPGQFGLSTFMYNTFTSDTNLDAPSKVAIAGKLADNLDGIASKIVAVSDYKDVATILADTKKGNDTAFATVPSLDLTRTEPLKAAIRLNIAKLYKDQKINSAADIAVAWKEMALGLRQIK